MLIEHREEPGFELRSIRLTGIWVVQYFFFREENAKHGAGLVADERDARFVSRLFPALKQRGGFLFKDLIKMRDRHHLLQRFDPGCNSERISGKGACLIDRAIRSDAVHDLSLSAVSRCREAAADDLAEAGHIRADMVARLRPVERGTEATHDFIKNEDSAMLFSLCSERFKETLDRRYAAHIARDRLNNDSSDLIPLFIHQLFERIDVIIRGNEGILCGAFRDTRTVRTAKGRCAGTRLDEKAVAVSMVAAFKFQDLITAGIASRCTKCAHRRFSAGVHHTEFFDGRIDFVNQLGDFCLHRCRRTVRGASLSCFLNGSNDSWMCVSEDHRSPGADVIDIGISIDICDMRTFRRRNEGRRAAHVRVGTDRTIDPAGHEFPRFFKRSFGFREIDHFPASSFIHFATSGA